MSQNHHSFCSFVMKRFFCFFTLWHYRHTTTIITVVSLQQYNLSWHATHTTRPNYKQPIKISNFLMQVEVKEDTCSIIPWCQPYSWRSELRASAKRHLRKAEEEEEAARGQEVVIRRSLGLVGGSHCSCKCQCSQMSWGKVGQGGEKQTRRWNRLDWWKSYGSKGSLGQVSRIRIRQWWPT